jgi:hypothetical protein
MSDPGSNPKSSSRNTDENAAAGTSRDNSPLVFDFVANDRSSRSQIRSHAMRQSWKQRIRGPSNSPTTHTSPRHRDILPHPSYHRGERISRSHRHTRSSNKVPGENSTEVSDVEMDDVSRRSESYIEETAKILCENEDDELLTRDGVFVDLRHTMISLSERDPLKCSTVPSSLGQRSSPYRSLGQEFDPFETVQLSRADSKLLYHCKSHYSSNGTQS